MESNKIFIRTNNVLVSEVQYIVKTIFNFFIQVIQYEIIFDDSCSEDLMVFTFIIDGQKKELVLSKQFFNTANKNWLQLESLPKPNLEEFPINDLIPNYPFSTTPVLFGLPVIEYQNDNRIICKIDLLGSIFFMLTLYEERVLNINDIHGRFDHKYSIFHINNLYRRPLVNEYVYILKSLLIKLGFIFKDENRKYNVILSHDVDVPGVYTFSFIRLLKNISADIFFRRSLVVAYLKIYSWFLFRFFGKISMKDPLFNFELIMDISDAKNITSQFNFIPKNGLGGIDGNYDLHDVFLKKQLQIILSRGHKIGIHPGYFTMNDFDELKVSVDNYITILKSINLHNIKLVGRQHYLRWQNPITWRFYNLLKISQDSSIGSEHFIGFRSGTCYEYPVYDLDQRLALDLIEYPLIIMDVCLFKTKNYNQNHIQIQLIKNITSYFKGNLTLLYHNNYITTSKQKKSYVKLLDYLCA